MSKLSQKAAATMDAQDQQARIKAAQEVGSTANRTHIRRCPGCGNPMPAQGSCPTCHGKQS